MLEKIKSLQCFLESFDPGDKDENFAYEAEKILSDNMDVRSALEFLNFRCGYVVGSGPFFEHKFELLLKGLNRV